MYTVINSNNTKGLEQKVSLLPQTFNASTPEEATTKYVPLEKCRSCVSAHIWILVCM